ncbi:alpha/beta hydrolase [Pseudoxanthomonas sp. CF125]|uniref:alpha/beta fold hydrolase n=1 Tax=Pseudoxanthomonas sp. CF125 TaxID=1855303 RepID=UPI000889ADFC|nr:alpha/beta hydrolase [Pseudoxanthomonas sp. CF125]SDQ76791.1 Pimeloyl-ACP methyl ester carboxylesterase [Pseudoxanthomonas sp. CF125]
MRFPLSALVLLAALLPARAQAQDTCPDRSAYEPAREIIRDLGKIVAPNGVQETYAARIGGIDQWLSVRGQDRDNPMVLFVHGGPAAPIMPSQWQFQRPLEEYFTIVNYDQRGAGKTYNSVAPDSIADTIHIQRYVDDAIEMAEYLRKRYSKRKLILMGHSWGTVVAMHAALKRPDLFHAYVGIGQVVNTRENERISFEYGLQQAQAHGNAEAIREMGTIAPYPGTTPITRERIVIARKWPQFYGGLTAFREDSTYYYRAPRLSPEYSDRDRCAIDAGNVFSLGRLLDEFLQVDFTGVKEFPIPVVMFMGRHDYTTPSAPTERWLRQVKAPYKRGVWFEHSAHMMPWEEPGKTLVSLLEQVRPLAVEGDAGR